MHPYEKTYADFQKEHSADIALTAITTLTLCSLIGGFAWMVYQIIK